MKNIHPKILPKISASIERHELTNFLESAQLLGYYSEKAIILLRGEVGK
jgi:hypothetical protein